MASMGSGDRSEQDPESRKSGHAELPERLRYKPMGVAYQGALESVFAIVIGVVAGWWADRYFGTEPWCLLVGATIGFAAFVLRLSRLRGDLDQASSDPGDAAARPGLPGDPSQTRLDPRQETPRAERRDERPEQP